MQNVCHGGRYAGLSSVVLPVIEQEELSVFKEPLPGQKK